MNKEILKLACAIIPGLMVRHEQPGYSDKGAVWEAFHIAQSIIEEIEILPKFHADYSYKGIKKDGVTQ